MKCFKWLLVCLAVIAFTGKTTAQQYKFLATEFSVMERDAKGNWGKWSDLQPAKITVVLDTKKDRIIVYSQEIQVYAILNYEKEEETEDDLIYPFSCTDDDGMPFTISIITRKKQNNRKQLYINQKNAAVVYNIINYPDKDIEIK
ncbi:hypothetical protein [Flavobacterium silvaticum]|uniref:Uncharacterized protein n=1 Tax=Flavobacterium silvaticum TaxID=1852020 RepID=A0A972FUL7_9FLAO|nr:hypothetical protein [Flavobacterium silvaticum]NMH27890.1 hypothetical protein [Flavobacterium silvaticum]